MTDTTGFSLLRGGPTWRMLRALSARVPWAGRAGGVALALVLLTMGPTVALATMEGSLLSGRVDIPLTGDWYVMARFLAALPLLVMAAVMSDRMVATGIHQLMTGGTVPASLQPEATRQLQRAYRARDSVWPELVCLMLAVLPTLTPALVAEAAPWHEVGMSIWWQGEDGTRTPAGQWLAVVAAPVFRFVVLLWVWRLLLWTWLMWRFSRMALDVPPTHPDRCGGLSFLGLAQSRFAVLVAAGGLVLCGYLMNQLVYGDETLTSVRMLVFGYAIGVTLLMVAPMLVYAPMLAQAKRDGLARHGDVGHAMARGFESQCAPGGPGAERPNLLESAAPSALADYSALHANVAGMVTVPIKRWSLSRLVFAALLPFLPLVLVSMPLSELAKHLASILM